MTTEKKDKAIAEQKAKKNALLSLGRIIGRAHLAEKRAAIAAMKKIQDRVGEKP